MPNWKNQLKRGASGRDNLDRQGFTKNILYRKEQNTQKGCDSQGADQQNIQEYCIIILCKIHEIRMGTVLDRQLCVGLNVYQTGNQSTQAWG
jgi:hypothetical protein